MALARRWVVDYFNRHDDDAAREFTAPTYTLDIGDHRFEGRDAQWLPAVAAQMRRFPGLGMTVHQVLAGIDRVALHFSEHGADGGPGGPVAVWSGVAIYRCESGRLVGCVAQEDYATRQRQLRTGVCDPVEAPAAAPWDTVPEPPEPGVETALKRWLARSWPSDLPGLRCDDEHLTGDSLRFEVHRYELKELLISGTQVALHARQHGRWLGGGLAGMDTVAHGAQWLDLNGLLDVVDGEVRSGRVIRDRLGLRTRLIAATRQGAPR